MVFNKENGENREEKNYYENETIIANFKELKEENYKLKQEIQGYYGDLMLIKEKEKMLRLELGEKTKKSMIK